MKNTSQKPGFVSASRVARAGVIAGMYLVLILITPFTLSFGPFQFRLAEALTLLPMLTADAIPGLFVGCLMANLLGGGVWFDVVLGSIATLLAAICTYKTRKKPLLAAFFPALLNTLIVGPVVYFAYVLAPGEPMNVTALLMTMGSVGLGEIVVCYTLGLALYYALKQLPDSLFE